MKAFPESCYVNSVFLNRTVRIDIIVPDDAIQFTEPELLVVQDGQDLEKMRFNALFKKQQFTKKKLICVGVHAGVDRIQEYGVSGIPDFQQRGAKAGLYAQFVLLELFPMVQRQTGCRKFSKCHTLGFSLGGLMSVDMALCHADIFHSAAAFSGAFWWRSRDLNNGYDDDRDRILHNKIRTLNGNKKQHFFFQAGRLDEKADRNGNGIIDAIDDTLDLIKALNSSGYAEKNIKYMEIVDGTHDVETWGRVMPAYLDWVFSIQ